MTQDFFNSYLQYVNESEPPVIFHRWSAIASIGAILERNFYVEHGHFSVCPNFYIMLIGVPGTRKSGAIKIAVKLLQNTGYATFAAEKTSKEKFIMDLAEGLEQRNADDFLSISASDSSTSSPCFIAADEFNDFFGNNIMDFVGFLGTIWDKEGPYRNRIKNGQCVIINNPAITLLSGNTPETFSSTFPPQALGQGFFSRCLFIYSSPSKKKFTFPPTPTKEETEEIIKELLHIKARILGKAEFTSTAKKLLNKIYHSNREIEDARFASYLTRRFTHLLKLCLVHSAAALHTTIDENIVIKANTVLHFAERFMPKALGEFGKARHSDVAHKVISFIESAYKVVTFQEIWAQVYQDLEKTSDLVVVLNNLQLANKIQQVRAVANVSPGFLPKRAVLKDLENDAIDWSYLTKEERDLL